MEKVIKYHLKLWIYLYVLNSLKQLHQKTVLLIDTFIKIQKTEIMKKIIILLTIICAGSLAHSQNVKQDKNGNYISIYQRDTTSAKPTGKTFTDTKGNTYPVYVSKNGKLFVMRTSKAGNNYKQYLKL